ncbi:pantoate--beta-alanine ligase [Moraxella bovis]|uniref:pantoate--beta-alanine ligase n=1 Tax=Moraxella bovis TaxID=476 RepID=UPI0022261E37|nr:pantoate--beta-alanine ligase [Moraxella bovis]UYZ68601.1 pantoate--beta-alanine ligase [Moraxella bovis]UYZ70973.1 pantoate--beta-alanine ligase [Moraxella bovis]UYZ73105.1 pantoate--beta-alanine ligase [Moraxella bovis]UZA14274.1 pantoate--beta-alanine ligase [Moraxella bovis]UZA27368.1 pantoate--beta-alanine ligase [Moraxella bovis]
MKIFHHINDLQTALNKRRKDGKTIGFVPTMGNLHDGHLSLVNIAKAHADIVVVSIFVNPTQFGADEDFDSYPRTLDADCEKLQSVQADMVFAPSIDEMYPTYPPHVQVLSGEISKMLCGKSRPTHFDGVGLVVGKLINIVRPDVAVFGKKDYQQLAIIRRLNDELNFGIKIIGGEIVRNKDGLALSSRNDYLNDDELTTAPIIQKTLQKIKADVIKSDINNYPTIIQKYYDELTNMGLNVDYLELYNDKLEPVKDTDKKLVVLTAVYVGKARLLDNIEIDLSDFL